MKKLAILTITVAAALPACAAVSFGADNVQEHTHRSFPASAIHSVSVENVSGPVNVIASSGAQVVVDAVKHGSDKDALARTHVDIEQNGSDLQIHTDYDKGGSWFGGHNGASVTYTIHMPAQMDVNIANVSGAISIQGIAGDVRANEVSGDIRAVLGRVAASRSVKVSAVSGAIDVQIAKNSAAQVQAKTVSGAIHSFFPANIHKGYVGESLSGQIGSGGGSMKFSTISGGISITAQ